MQGRKIKEIGGASRKMYIRNHRGRAFSGTDIELKRRLIE
jgi:hypothetical protein